jgi:putative selenium metabolism hydrolase
MEQRTEVSPEYEPHVRRLTEESTSRCIDFLRDLVTVPSPSRGERLACERVMQEMQELGYQDVHLDEMGNVLGRFGSGARVVAFDAHVDTVGITNPTSWKYDPFRGVVSGGTLYGRGASDQKGGLATIVHGAAVAARLGIPDDLTVWVTATVNGEDCVGLAWQYLCQEKGLRPEVVVIAMPSHLGICHGQRGRMEVEISTAGVSTHGSQPERGSNAIYAMVPIVQAVDRLNASFVSDHPMLGPGSIAITEIVSRSPSLTAIPDECTIHIDRRLTIGESADGAIAQLEALPEVTASSALITLLDYDHPSWRGLRFPTKKVFPAWETKSGTAAVGAAVSTAQRVLGREPRIHRSAFSSNGCATAGMFGIPTVGFGPGDEVHSHTVQDQIHLAQLQPAMAFFALFPEVYLRLSAPE